MEKKKPVWQRGMAIVMAAAMVGTMVPTSGLVVKAETGGETGLLADFDFDDEATGFSGGSAVAAIQSGGTYRLDDYNGGKALYLNGNGNYLTVKNQEGGSLLTGVSEMTVSYDAKPDRTATNWPFYAAPNDKAQTNAQEHYLGIMVNNGTTKIERYNNTNGRPATVSASTGADWAHIDVVFTADATTLYVNGAKKGVVASDYQLEDILGNASILQLGKANWVSGEYYKGWLDNFKIYGRALSDSELVEEAAGQQAVEADKAALTLTSPVKADFELPQMGTNGSSISWSVEENSAITIEGNLAKVTRGSKDQEINLKAVLSMGTRKGTVTASKTIGVTVEKLAGDAAILNQALEKLQLVNMDNVRGNINLPTEVVVDALEKNAVVEWTSSAPEIITDKEQGKKPAGVVTRQQQDRKVKLTAEVTVGEEHAEKEFELTVKAAAEQEETTDYLFAYFVNNGGAQEQQIFMASSHDGNNWLDLNKKEAVLSVADSVRTEEDIAKTQNQAGVRDPYLIRSPEGDKFYLIATDLCIGDENIAGGTVGWGTSQYNGSHCLRIWESDDLVNWSEPWLSDVAPENTTCAWAPEAIYDDTTGAYIVYWASMTGSVQKVYYSRTRDFKNYSKPELFIDNGNDHIIDTTIVKDSKGNYYRGSAAGGTIQLEKCTDSEKWLTDQSSWTAQGNIGKITGFTAGLEGPELFVYNKDDWKEVNGVKTETYGLLADNYGGAGYVPFYTTDIANAKWMKTAETDYNFDTLHKRHGTVLALTAEEYDRVMEAYGPNKIEVKTQPSKLLYHVGAKSLNPAGLVLTVNYPNGKTEDVSYNADSKNKKQFSFQGMDFTKEGEQTVTVTYGEQHTQFIITVEKQPEIEEKILAEFDFNEDGSGFTSDNAKAEGSYTLKDSYAEAAEKALYLDGSTSNFLKVTDKKGNSLLTGLQEMTISFEMKPDRTDTNWALYAAPSAKSPVYNKEQYLGIMVNGGTTKLERYQNNGSRPAENPTAATGSGWSHVDFVLTETESTIYVNGVKQQTADSNYTIQSILGSDSILQIGKANWGNGEYYKGWLDNLVIRNKALDEKSIKELSADFMNTQPIVKEVLVGTAPNRETALDYRGTDDHTAVYTEVNEETKEIISYVRKGTDITKVPVTITAMGEISEIKMGETAFENGGTLDLSKDVTLTVSRGERKEIWTVKTPVLSNNPVLPGQYADPDIDYMDGKFWIFPTTDGYPGWSGAVFHAFSSEDMTEWKDEGIILDLADDAPGENEQGIQIAASSWAVGSAWAPTVEEKGGKYYFYYCGKFQDGQSAIGVAVADNPAGPYTDKGEALLTVQMCRDAGVSMGQAIDPSIFTDEDGTSYIMFGNGSAAIAQLNDDMMSIKECSLKAITGLTDFRESVVVTKANGRYHWTWSCDDANSPNYHVNYGVSDTLTKEDGSAVVTLVKKNLLSKDESKGILGSAHQSVVQITDTEGKERYFMAYHRFYTPLNIFTSGDGLGTHRETCIDEITFDANGYMEITPTLLGVSEVTVKEQESSGLLADFNFDTEDSGLISENAKAEGNYTLKDSYENGGKALYLDGSSNQYLTVTKKNGESLLTGLEELTISYEMKADRTGANWLFYAAPDNHVQKYAKEHYIGILEKDGNTTAERYNNTNGRPISPSAAIGDGWVHVDVVLSSTDTTIYVDGVQKSQESSTYKISDILGANSILQIGKANWEKGEYFKGWIDNFKIYDRALSAEEILTVPKESYVEMLLQEKTDSIEPLLLSEDSVTLPDYGGSVTWKSNMEQVVIAEDGRTASVTRPEAGSDALEGTMTAVVLLYGQRKEVEVKTTVKPQAADTEDYGYLMVHFVEDSNGYAEKIYLDISRGDNPEQWDPLNGGQPVLASQLGTTGVRDPYITYNPETETYYILATDLRVFGGDNAGWGSWQKNYSTKMNIWESKDLVTWSEVRQFDVALNAEGEKQANLGMMWAPEATWVPDYYGEGDGAFVVYWSSQVYEDEAQTKAKTGSDIMWGATKDFTQDTWEYGGEFLGGDDGGWIDTTIIQNEGKTYHITKSNREQIILESTADKEWWKEGTKWTRIQSKIGESRFGSVEGPAIFKDHSENNRWYLFVDDLPSPGYQPMISTDLEKGFTYLDSTDYYLTPNTKHGGVISLTKGQYDTVRNADAVTAEETELGITEITVDRTEAELAAKLPQTAQVELAYDRGTSDLPVVWDTSAVDLKETGTYTVTGTVQSLGANKNQWVGKNSSTDYRAEDKQLYSSTAIQVTAQVEVKEASEILPELTGISVTPPAKTEYQKSEELVLDGMLVTAHYSDESTLPIEAGYEISGYDKEQTGVQTVTVTYKGMTASFEVTVKEDSGENKPDPTKTPNKPAQQKPAKTGDETNMEIFVFLLMVAAGAGITITAKKKRHVN